MLFAERRKICICTQKNIHIQKQRQREKRVRGPKNPRVWMFMKAERQSEPTSAKVNAIPLRTREQEGEMLKIMLIIRVVIMSVNKCSVVMMGLSQRRNVGSPAGQRQAAFCCGEIVRVFSSSGSSLTLIVSSCWYFSPWNSSRCQLILPYESVTLSSSMHSYRCLDSGDSAKIYR